jgi:SAM-dependent methyltransferase
MARQISSGARASYGSVWDQASVSGSATNARVAVAGTADPAEYDRSGASTADDIVQLAQVGPADTVVEIGCGTGRIGVKLAPRCGRWIGCDVSRNMLAHARETLRGHGNVSFVHLNGLDLAGLEDGSADVVYCSGVLMHVDEWERYRYVVEAFRVLRPGGRVYYDNFDLTSPEGWQVFEGVLRLEPAARPPHVSRSSTAAELQTYAEHAGFVHIQVLRRGLWVTVVAVRPSAP